MEDSNSNYGNINFNEEIVEESLKFEKPLVRIPINSKSIFFWDTNASFERTTHESWNNLSIQWQCTGKECFFFFKSGILPVYK